MKKTYDIRKLCDGISRKINIADNYDFLFKQWKKMFIETVGEEPTELDVFYAGYILSNPTVREMYTLIRGDSKNEKIELHRNDAFN